MSNYTYFPLIKTRDAELKAMSKLDDISFSKTLPIYELTKSRKTKIAPDGDIHRRMHTITEIQKSRPFILDVSVHEKYTNPQMEQLLNPHNGYYEWQYFINYYKDINMIPMVHLYDEEDFSQVEIFVEKISRSFNNLAVRLPYDLENYDKFINPIIKNLNDNCKLYIILDGEQVNASNNEFIADSFVSACEELDKFNINIEDIIIISTSFPSSTADYGDSEGEFPIFEEKIYKKVSEEYPIKYGDYASINIQQIEMKGGTFVPRIDISLDERFIYKRYRRNEGSYTKCAVKMIDDVRYKSLKIWADEEITIASHGAPSGISPSFWIAVRMNYFMTSRIKLRS